jgi:hypothetical protein
MKLFFCYFLLGGFRTEAQSKESLMRLYSVRFCFCFVFDSETWTRLRRPAEIIFRDKIIKSCKRDSSHRKKWIIVPRHELSRPRPRLWHSIPGPSFENCRHCLDKLIISLCHQLIETLDVSHCSFILMGMNNPMLFNAIGDETEIHSLKPKTLFWNLPRLSWNADHKSKPSIDWASQCVT